VYAFFIIFFYNPCALTSLLPIDDISDSDEEEKLALAEVEDLCTTLEPEAWETEDLIKTRRQWKSQHHESRDFIERKQALYLARDDLHLKTVGSKITRIDRESDEMATREEFSFVSLFSKEGVMVRRDAIHVLQTKKKIKHDTSSTKPDDSALTRVDSKRQDRHTIEIVGKGEKTLILDKRAPVSPRINSQTIEIFPPLHSTQINSPKSDDNDPFWGSCVELCSVDQNLGTRSVRLANAIASHLKPHQIEGIKFMWRNTCSDLPMIQTREEMLLEKDVGGCILAHMMGLGKLTFRAHLMIEIIHLRNYFYLK
jgi:SNF2 family DNA or RNA helicase